MRLKNHLIRAASGAAASAVMAAMILTACGATPTPPGASGSTVPASSGSTATSEVPPTSSSSVSSSSSSASSAESKPASSESTSSSSSAPASSSNAASSSSSASSAESKPASSESTSSPSSTPASSSNAASSSSSASSAESKPASSESSSSSESRPSSSSSTTPEKPEEVVKNLIVEDNGHYYTGRVGSQYCFNFYYFKIRNPNETKAIKSGKINYVIRNANGNIVTSTVIYLPTIAAGDTIEISGSVSVSAAEKPSSAEYKIEYSKYGVEDQESSGAIRSSELVVSNPYRIQSGTFPHFTGEVTNKSDKDASRVKVMLLYQKDGRTYGGDSWYVGNIPAGETKAFELITLYELNSYDSYRIVVVQG